MTKTKTELYYRIKKTIAEGIHIKKCKANLSHEQWQILDTDNMGEEIAQELIQILEAYLYIPCCHTSGLHDPQHYERREYICNSQLAEAFKRFCKDLGINPVTRMKPNCCWCKDYPIERNGEGLHLFEQEKAECPYADTGHKEQRCKLSEEPCGEQPETCKLFHDHEKDEGAEKKGEP